VSGFVGIVAAFIGFALAMWCWGLLGERDMVLADRDWWHQYATKMSKLEHELFLQLCEERRQWVAELLRLNKPKDGQ
jgi:hypothetical protein